MSTIIDGTTGITFPDASTQAKAVSQVTPFAVTASAIAGAELQLPEATANGVNYVALKAPNTLTVNTTFTLPSADGTNGQFLQTNGSGALAFATVSSAVNYPQNIQSADYTLVLGDAGKQIFHPVADTTTRTYTIPANSSVAFPIGTVVLFTVENAGIAVNVAITSDTLVFGSGTTGTLAVAANNTLMCIKVTSTKWMANYLYQTGGAGSTTTIAVGHTSSPYVSAYPWTGGSGFGVKYTDPATLPAGQSNGVAISFAGKALAVAHDTSPFVTAYPWNVNGFGVKYTNPATLPASTGSGVAFSPAGNAIAVSSSLTPFIQAYPWNASTGFGTKYTNPATLPASTGQSVAFSPASDAIIVGHAAGFRVSAYPWNSGTGFGTKYADPATGVTGSTVNGVAFSPAGDAVAAVHPTTPFNTVYAWSVSTGFGAKYADPATLPTGTGRSVAFSPAGNAIAVAHEITPFVTAYPWSGAGFGTKYTNPVTLPAGDSYGVSFSPAGDTIAVASNAGTIFPINAYPWTVGSGFGARYANPTTIPTGNGTSVVFSTAA